MAKLLDRAGVSVGRQLIAGDAANPDGYFEEQAVVVLNDEILARAGLFAPFSMATRAEVRTAARPYTDEMRALAASATPAWKDPRFSWTLEAWLAVLPEAPRLIVCLRSPAEVAASTLRYFGRGDDAEATAAALHLWRAQYERLIEVIEAYRLQALCVEYGRLHAGDAATVAALAGFVGCALDAAGVRRELRHHVLAVEPGLQPLYDRVRALRPGRTAAARTDAGAPSA
ncbi:MAG: sulfotransferase [Dehalococcoidia bacterium]|nr:sulfotransferase [Dehalococcoidia bacterium]